MPILTEVEPGDPVPATGAVYLLGGGEDAAQISAVNALKADGDLFEAVDDGAVLFAVCAGYQIAGRTFTVGEHDEVIDGLGLLDVTTRRGPERAVGEILSRWTRPDGVGEPDHRIREPRRLHDDWALRPTPLARVEIGIGNADDGTEGAVQGRVIGTYPHGPILARNPELADHLLEVALDRDLEPLPRPELDELRRQRIAAVRRAGLRR